MSVEAIATETGVPANTVKSWLARGRQRLAAQFTEPTTNLEVRDA
ncbi:hypothetical protein Afe04nite_72900 [Asanoa ferruginea]|nr:hypothetical protein Afe04nite_72900 [Asanoa ferruginea]